MKSQLNNNSTINDSEITLFKNMSAILSATYHVAFVEETHQHYVSYTSPQARQTATREISDLWIIAFSPSHNKMRMTFLQAKYHRAILNRQHNSFKGDFFQYELLSQRPTLSANVGKSYNFPLDILSFSCCASIGSYGVFFIDSNNQIDLAYCSANGLTNKSASPQVYASVRIDLEIPYYQPPLTSLCNCSHCSELISCFDIDTFTNAIVQLEIGAEITLYPNILSFVRKVLQKLSSNNTVKQSIDFIDNLLPPNADEDIAAFDGLPTNLLIINTDPFE